MRFLLSTTAIVLIAGSAMAADIGVAPLVTKGPVMAVPFTWSGFYVGANVGAGWGTTSSTVKTFLGNSTDLSLSSASSSGFLGGGTIGYNYQLPSMPVVFGIEGDFEALGLEDTSPCLVALNCDNKAKWEADIAARLGLAYGNMMLFAKSGVAWAQFDHSVTGTGGIGNFTATANETPLGLLFGAGVEYAFANNWAARLEYDFIDFQDKTLDLHVSGFGNGALNSVDYRKSMNMLKAGIEYKF